MNKIILLLILISANLFALPVIKNPELSNAVASVESAFANKQYKSAEKYCKQIFNMKNPAAQKELKDLKTDDNSPYNLRLHLILLDCMFFNKKSHSEFFKNECEKTIAEYKDLPEAKYNLQWVYLHLSRYYHAVKNKKMKTQVLKEGADFLPESQLPTLYVINLMNNCHKSIPKNTIAEIKRIFNKNKEVNNGKLTPRLAYYNVILTKRTGGNVFPAISNFLTSYPNAKPIELINAIKMARDVIPFDKPEQVRKYYNMLLILAVKQINTKERLKVIGFIINEKKKLEVIIPNYNVILTKRTGGNVFPAINNFLTSYSNAKPIELINAIKMARDAIPFDKPEQVRKYYNMLLILAVKQVNTKERLKVIGFIINEKKKLETIMPELRK